MFYSGFTWLSSVNTERFLINPFGFRRHCEGHLSRYRRAHNILVPYPSIGGSSPATEHVAFCDAVTTNCLGKNNGLKIRSIYQLHSYNGIMNDQGKIKRSPDEISISYVSKRPKRCKDG
jgi:hypothetical protein